MRPRSDSRPAPAEVGTAPPRQFSGRVLSVAIVVAGFAAVVVSGLLYVAKTTVTGADTVHVELAGRAQPLPLSPAMLTALREDYLFIAGYGAALGAWLWAASQVVRTPRGSSVVRAAAGLAAVAVLADCAENGLLLLASSLAPSAAASLPADAASGMAILKFSALVPAVLVAIWGAYTLVARAVVNSAKRLAGAASRLTPSEQPPLAHSAAPVEGDDAGASWRSRYPPAPALPATGYGHVQTRWRNGFRVPDVHPEKVLEDYRNLHHTIGFCLSGGGIRAGSVALGALQSLRPRLLHARYLVSVSGGGIASGAMSLALAPRPGAGETATDPATDPTDAGDVPTLAAGPAHVFDPGTVETAHLRQHTSYLAGTPGEMLTALGVVFGHLVASLALLLAPAVVAGGLVGLLYRAVPITDLSAITPPAPGGGVPFPTPRPTALWAIGILVGLAALAWLVHLGIETCRRHATSWVTWQRVATAVLCVAGLVAVLAVVLPALLWSSAWLLSRGGQGPIRLGGPIGAVVLTYLSTLAAMLWRNRKLVTSATATLGKKGSNGPGGIVAALPRGPVQYLLVVLTLLVLGVGWLLVCGGVATRGTSALAWALGTGAVLLVLGAVLDQTSLSLHPFYRKRLASAIAVRRVTRGGAVVAEPYRWEEPTTLSRYAHRRSVDPVRTTGFPSVIFAAAANLTGEHRTPPGLDAVSFTMSADWVGGPDVGWVRTSALEALVPPRLHRDLTVQGAVAISGSAFASAMGRSAAWYQTLLAVTGARLGAWLPSPSFVLQRAARADERDWRFPALPATRGLTYLLREILGIHRSGDRLLLVTDGGHYENLGLVELLRRRCTLVYCIDASGDAPPTAKTLAEAITLAAEELGVRIVPDDPWPLEPGTGAPVDKAAILTALNDKLSKSPVVTATIHYPPESGLPPEVTGRLIVAKALLDPGAPYEVLSYAAASPVFPHDSTGDQFFGNAQFEAYTALGRRLGQLAALQPVWPGPDGHAQALLGSSPSGSGPTTRAATGIGSA